MAGDASLRKYFAMLGLFTFSMLAIVLADNLLLLFVGWELVGFSSYMLIGHWKEKPEAARAAKKAFILNRIGDAGFLVGLMILWTNQGSFDISGVNSDGPFFSVANSSIVVPFLWRDRKVCAIPAADMAA
jgi:NADH-quinone oxidoreductase subunit L